VQSKFVIYAPNVASGGGLVLLKAMLSAWPSEREVAVILDVRGREAVGPSISRIKHYWVTSTITGRLAAEWKLRKTVKSGDVVLCFHSLPPIFSSQGRILCYVHNPNLVGLVKPNQNSLWVRIRSSIENFIFSLFQGRISDYMVQTPSMQNALKMRVKSKNPNIHVVPFLDYNMMPKAKNTINGTNISQIQSSNEEIKRWDFLYVSDGVPHKNHRNLIAAWEILAQENCFPSIAITLRSDRDAELINILENKKENLGIKIYNIGQLPHHQIIECYHQSKALLFASFAETFGIPLMEAKSLNLPIIAAEMDFVRDVCDPLITFDPHSPVSIARAVKRFLGHQSAAITPLTADLFNEKLYSFK